MSLNERLEYLAMKARHKNLIIPWYKKWWGILILIFLALFLIVLSFSTFYVIGQVRSIRSQAGATITKQDGLEYIRRVNGDGTNYYLGTDTPQVTLVEFGDFACPYSQMTSTTTRKIAEEFKDQLKFVWRDYLRNQDSIDLAMAARCAGEQGKFWEMHDLLFAHQADLATADAARIGKLADLAGLLGINTTQFSACLTERKYLNQIKSDYQDGNALQIIGTPSWFVNNYAFAGTVSEEKFRELLGGLIKK